jgi:hypothetical protein
MPERESSGQELAKGAERVAAHAAATVVGLILMILGLGMGVSIVLLPLGIAVGLVGLAVVFWGLFARAEAKQEPPADLAPKVEDKVV